MSKIIASYENAIEHIQRKRKCTEEEASTLIAKAIAKDCERSARAPKNVHANLTLAMLGRSFDESSTDYGDYPPMFIRDVVDNYLRTNHVHA